MGKRCVLWARGYQAILVEHEHGEMQEIRIGRNMPTTSATCGNRHAQAHAGVFWRPINSKAS